MVHSKRRTLQTEKQRLQRMDYDLQIATQRLAPLDILTASHLDWARIHVLGALRELDHLIRIAQYEASKRGGP